MSKSYKQDVLTMFSELSKDPILSKVMSSCDDMISKINKLDDSECTMKAFIDGDKYTVESFLDDIFISEIYKIHPVLLPHIIQWTSFNPDVQYFDVRNIVYQKPADLSATVYRCPRQFSYKVKIDDTKFLESVFSNVLPQHDAFMRTISRIRKYEDYTKQQREELYQNTINERKKELSYLFLDFNDCIDMYMAFNPLTRKWYIMDDTVYSNTAMWSIDICSKLFEYEYNKRIYNLRAVEAKKRADKEAKEAAKEKERQAREAAKQLAKQAKEAAKQSKKEAKKTAKQLAKQARLKSQLSFSKDLFK